MALCIYKATNQPLFHKFWKDVEFSDFLKESRFGKSIQTTDNIHLEWQIWRPF